MRCPRGPGLGGDGTYDRPGIAPGAGCRVVAHRECARIANDEPIDDAFRVLLLSKLQNGAGSSSNNNAKACDEVQLERRYFSALSQDSLPGAPLAARVMNGPN